jgi:hypothetical protein
MMIRVLRGVSLVVAASTLLAHRALAEPVAEGPPALAQPHMSADRAAGSQLDLARTDIYENKGWLVTERLTVDWALGRSWLLSAALPVAYGHESGGSDPEITHSTAVLGNPALLGRWRAVPIDGASRLELALGTGVAIPTAGEPSDLSRGADKIRFNAEVFHRLHRPYEFGFLVAVPVRADLRWTRGASAAQAGVAVYTVVDHGDPEVDVIQASAGFAYRLAGGPVLAIDGHLLASPPGDFYHVDVDGPQDSALAFGVEAGFTVPLGIVDLGVRFYLPQLPDYVSGQALGLDLRYRIE